MGIFRDVQALENEVKFVFGEFSWNGTTVTKVIGRGYTIAHSATGKVLVTLQEKYPRLLYADCKLSLTTASAERQQLGAVNMGAGTVEFCNVNATPALANPSSTQTYYFVLALRRSDVR